ncbi:MAG: DsbA family protein [Nanoarchaeota archaeon]|nr:DsbA family protein [Nanoarchaeota archaeon]
MICIIALIVFGILGIFSASYRIIAKEAFDCVFRKITFRKCDTGLDQRLKSQITGKLMRHNYTAGSWVFRHFEILSWIFTIMMIVSLGYSAQGIYNYAKYGNCNGPQGGFCIFDPFNSGNAQNPIGDLSCQTGNHNTTNKLVPPSTDDDPYLGPENAAVVLIEVGCFQCPATKEAQPAIEKIAADYRDTVKIVFVDLPIVDIHNNSELSAEAAECAREQGKFWEYGTLLFNNQPKADNSDLINYAKDIKLNETQFSDCLNSGKYSANVKQDLDESTSRGYYGTPTIFVNNQFFVGPQDYKTLKQAIDEELAKPKITPIPGEKTENDITPVIEQPTSNSTQNISLDIISNNSQNSLFINESINNQS